MVQKHTLIIASYLAASLLTVSNAAAQTPPVFDAGALMRQNEQSIQAQQQQMAVSKRVLLPPAAVLSDTTVVKPDRFKFLGNQRLSNEQLQAVTVPFANRTLNKHDLLYLTDAVVQEYRKAGWLVRAYIPQQNLAGPELSIQVVESIPPIKP
jgi:hemolysin activation/secretion protein